MRCFLYVRGANQYPLRCMNHNDIPNSQSSHINSLRPRRSRRHFADDIFKRIFLKANVRISIKISLKFDPKSPIDNIPPLFQIMAWRRPGDKPLSEAMMVSLLTHICVTRLQWVKHTSNHTPGLFNYRRVPFLWGTTQLWLHVDGWVLGSSISNALAMEIVQSSTKPSVWLQQNTARKLLVNLKPHNVCDPQWLSNTFGWVNCSEGGRWMDRWPIIYTILPTIFTNSRIELPTTQHKLCGIHRLAKDLNTFVFWWYKTTEPYGEGKREKSR